MYDLRLQDERTSPLGKQKQKREENTEEEKGREVRNGKVWKSLEGKGGGEVGKNGERK